jgi:hypothetical protein
MSKWKDLVTASLIGTERAVVPRVEIPGLAAVDTASAMAPLARLPGSPGSRDAVREPAAGPVGPAEGPVSSAEGPVSSAEGPVSSAEGPVSSAEGPVGLAEGPVDPAGMLLDQAALMTAARRAGQRPGPAEPLPGCEPDPGPAVSPAAARRLARIMGGEHSDLLAEWLGAAAARGLRPPPQLLPALLETARANPESSGWRRLVAEAGGSRARWLAGLNPDWEFAAQETGPAADAWRLGDPGQRRGYLAALRATDPAAARELVTASWEEAGSAERAGFLAVLTDGLGPADEPLLEAALDDRAAEVRSRAAFMLATLPGSALGLRMTERALRCLRIEQGNRGTRLVTVPPVGSDASMRRDGIAPSPVAGRPQLADLNRFVVEILARTPLRAWTDAFGLTAAQVLAVPAGDWTPVLFVGWSRAAAAQHDRDWTAALFGRALTGWPVGTPTVTEALRRLARRADPSLGAPGALAEPGPDAPAAVRAAVGVLRFRHDMLRELEDDNGGG